MVNSISVSNLQLLATLARLKTGRKTVTLELRMATLPGHLMACLNTSLSLISSLCIQQAIIKKNLHILEAIPYLFSSIRKVTLCPGVIFELPMEY